MMASLLAVGVGQLMASSAAALSATATCSDLSPAPHNDKAACGKCKSDFLGLIPWYEYLPMDQGCNITAKFEVKDGNQPDSSGNNAGLNKLWLIALAVFEDLLRVAGMITVGYIIYGGVRYITSQGEPENTKAARETIINALIGAVIVIVAASSVGFIAKALGGA